MIHKSWCQRIQLFMLGALIVMCLQNVYSLANRVIPAPQSEAEIATCRMIQHELGESCIPRHPKRVIVMDQESLEILVALGVNPIAAATANRVGNKAGILQHKIDIATLTDLGKEGQPNLERIVKLKPDLIVGMFINSHLYSLLSHIAPTISVRYSQTGWKQTLREVAEVLDRTPKANELLTAYQQRIAQLRSQLARQSGTLQISAMRFYTDAHLTQFLNQNSFTINVLEELQVLSIPEIQRQRIQVPNSDYGYINISLERIDWLEADVLFAAVDPGAESSLKLYANSPIWQTLDVVKRQHVYTVDSGYWIFGNILAANAILDDVLKYLGQPGQSSVPL